ncbi:hypothetical protein HUA78_35790 [Myxococcus sp. CA033]|uniref:hypothetical protein n=1 Tax=Myxococcus sp. CA033 TaxID=2741516 RepID=UPI00157A34CE|nr:hypothetical protein [Myxococcus sp. CA033]NTX39813.1 hypothetical protein [Myxococcus sp. CA033]
MKSFEPRRDVPMVEQVTSRDERMEGVAHPRVAALQALGARLNQGPRVVAQAKLAASLGGRSPNAPIQRVGGAKFGLRVADAARESAGHQRLREIHAAYKEEVKAGKAAAVADFDGHEDEIEAQTAYSHALENAELTPQGLVTRLGGDEDFSVAGDVISYQGAPLANILRGNAAYLLATPAAHGVANIYKKHTLEGPSDRDYVRVRGRMLRRQAWRGITPPERKALKEGRALTPMNRGHLTEGRLGYNFDASTGAPTPRVRNVGEGKVSDLEWLNTHANTQLDEIPNEPRLLSFLQTRKGVGKLLSARSTPGDITSNHGVGFSGYGEVEIDLARVPVANFVHHYKDEPFDADELAGQVGRNHPSGPLRWETDRANETVLRNREIVLSEIPRAAVTNLTDTPARQAYEAEFALTYTRYFQEKYREVVFEETELDEPAPIPAPDAIPYIEDHYTQLQARTDGAHLIREASTRGSADAAERVAYINAWRKSYVIAWKRAYEEAAWESAVYDDEGNTAEIVVPEPRLPDHVGDGLGEAAGLSAGGADGILDGAAATRSGPASSSSSEQKQQSRGGQGEDDSDTDEPKVVDKRSTRKSKGGKREKKKSVRKT